MPNYTVLVDALGYSGGCARKGETVTELDLGSENVDRLLVAGFIAKDFIEVPPTPITPPEEDAPETLASRLGVGLPVTEAHVMTEDEEKYLLDVKSGVVPVPFDEDAVANLTVKELKERIDGLGVEVGKDLKKKELVDALRDAVIFTFENWQVDVE